MRNKKLLIVVAIPIVLLCLLIARAEYHIQYGEQWSFKVAGYDPRDLLRGHYLRFNLEFDWDKDKNTCQSGKSCCLCLTKSKNNIAPTVYKTSCEVAKKQCDGFMQSEHQRSLNRFYIAESQAKQAEDLLREAQAKETAYLTVAIDRKGKPSIVDLLVNGKGIKESLE